jgi:putative spermidine/putrescine transport system permease protein
VVLLAALLMAPYALLVLLSLGSGWSFPHLLPDRLDLAPWRHVLSDRDGMLAAIATSAGMSLAVGALSTAAGLLIARSIARLPSPVWRFLIYLPFVTSPVVVGVCLYDLLVRLRLSGSMAGVVLTQLIFATAFASIFFSELWSDRAERLEGLVQNLGGGRWAVWRHAVYPQMAGLIVICFLQAALYSWLDYGLVSVVGGGHVPTVTTKVFAYIREASVNQAALSGLILLTPALGSFYLAGWISTWRRKRDTRTATRS